MASVTQDRPEPANDSGRARAPRAIELVVGGTLGVCTVLGAVAALLGGSTRRLGQGPGGLWGAPQLVLLAVALLVGLPAALVTLRRDRRTTSAVALVGCPIAVAVAFFVVPHAADPCAAGLWDLRSEFRSAPLCGIYGGEIGVEDRYHLLLHGAVTAVVAVPLLALLRAAAGAPHSGKLASPDEPAPPHDPADGRRDWRRRAFRRTIGDDARNAGADESSRRRFGDA